MQAADALYGPRGHENVILRIETRDMCTKKRISEQVAPIEIDTMERDAQIEAREFESQALDAVNQAVHESSGIYEAAILRELQEPL